MPDGTVVRVLRREPWPAASTSAQVFVWLNISAFLHHRYLHHRYHESSLRRSLYRGGPIKDARVACGSVSAISGRVVWTPVGLPGTSINTDRRIESKSIFDTYSRLEDLTGAADSFRPIHDITGGVDG